MHLQLLALHHLNSLAMSRRNVEQRSDLQRYLSRIVKLILVGNLGVSNLLIEALVLIKRHLSLVSVPYGLQVVHQTTVQFNRILVEYTVLANDFLHFLLARELYRILSQTKNNFGTLIKVQVFHVCNLVFTGTV